MPRPSSLLLCFGPCSARLGFDEPKRRRVWKRPHESLGHRCFEDALRDLDVVLCDLDDKLVMDPADEAAFPRDAGVDQPLLEQRNGDEADVSADALNGKRRGFGPGCVAWLPV